MTMKRLYELADDLKASASFEGCEEGLMVVDSQKLAALIQFAQLLKRADQAETAGQKEAERICTRLLDSEEHAGDAAVPDVANDAVQIINALRFDLNATQVCLEQAQDYSAKAGKLVTEVAALSVWGFDKSDGTPYEECPEPGDGFLDSHCCLMETILQCRDVQAAL